MAKPTQLSKQGKLANVTVANGASPGEEATAKARLDSMRAAHAGVASVPAVVSEESGDVWTGQAVLCRNRGGANAFLRASALNHFLSHLKDGQDVNYKSVPFCEGEVNYGTGDFYTIISWLVKFNLAIKLGSRYKIPSVVSIKKAFNRTVEEMKMKVS